MKVKTLNLAVETVRDIMFIAIPS